MTSQEQINPAIPATPTTDEKRNALRIKIGDEPMKRPALPCAVMLW